MREVFRLPSTSERLAGLWKSILSGFALLLPIWFVGRYVIRVRWSLLTFLLAVAVTIASMFAWQTLISSGVSLRGIVVHALITGFTGMGLLTLVWCVRTKSNRWTLLATAILIIVLTPLVVAVQKLLASQETPGYTIVATPGHYLAVVWGLFVFFAIALSVPLFILPRLAKWRQAAE